MKKNVVVQAVCVVAGDEFGLLGKDLDQRGVHFLDGMNREGSFAHSYH